MLASRYAGHADRLSRLAVLTTPSLPALKHYLEGERSFRGGRFVEAVDGQRVIWVHAVSVGEVRSAAALIVALDERYPEHRILVTTMTPTGSEQVQELFGDRVSHGAILGSAAEIGTKPHGAPLIGPVRLMKSQCSRRFRTLSCA